MKHLYLASECDPASPLPHTNLASALQSLGEMALAEKHYQVALDLAPGRSEAYGNLAQFLFSTGRYLPIS